MDQSSDNKIEFKDKILSFYNRNKYKIYIGIVTIIIVIASLIFIDIHKENKNKKIAEKYIQAGIYLSAGKKETAKNILEDIIKSKNKFYSILSLNAIIEKDLISDKEKILKYFEILENINFSDEQNDLISLKKALFLLKHSEKEKANDLLKKLHNKNSNLQIIIDEIIVK